MNKIKKALLHVWREIRLSAGVPDYTMHYDWKRNKYVYRFRISPFEYEDYEDSDEKKQ